MHIAGPARGHEQLLERLLGDPTILEVRA